MADTDLKASARSILGAALSAADPYGLVMENVRCTGDAVTVAGTGYPADTCQRIVVVGAGKASARMGSALEKVLGGRIDGGWINTKYGHALPLDHINVHECGHPVPDENGVAGAERITGLLESAGEDTLVICLLSGGGSALLPAPAEGVTLAEKREVTRLLMHAGADIGELNAVRKHLSRLKGGGMARLASPAALHVLILSDVIGDRLDTIASGPAAPDDTTFAQCIRICRNYGIYDSLPATVAERLERGAEGYIPETASPDEAFFGRVTNSIIGNNRIAVEAAAARARATGFTTLVLTTALSGEASQAGTFFGSVASEIHASGNPVTKPACIVAGGETTVTVRGTGTGGRNQEMALSGAMAIAGMGGTVFASIGTDGTDGPTDAAGAIVDGATVEKGERAGFSAGDSLRNNDSHHFLEAVGDLFTTGPTGTNVMDIQILLIDD